MRISSRVRILPACFVLALAACGDDGNSPVSKCASDVQISGSVTASMTACPSYRVTASTNPITTISMSVGTPVATHSILLGRDATRPAAGIYPIGTSAGNFYGQFSLNDGSPRGFAFTGGTVTISTSSAGTVSGTFNAVTAAEITAPGNTIALSGTFTAKCIPDDFQNC